MELIDKALLFIWSQKPVRILAYIYAGWFTLSLVVSLVMIYIAYKNDLNIKFNSFYIITAFFPAIALFHGAIFYLFLTMIIK